MKFLALLPICFALIATANGNICATRPDRYKYCVQGCTDIDFLRQHAFNYPEGQRDIFVTMIESRNCGEEGENKYCCETEEIPFEIKPRSGKLMFVIFLARCEARALRMQIGLQGGHVRIFPNM